MMMADWAVTMRRLPEDIAAQVSTVMVTVDPYRDQPSPATSRASLPTQWPPAPPMPTVWLRRRNRSG